MHDIEIKFKCKNCQQEYWQDTFNISVFLYGIFFLMGKESGYTGITCPSCLETITHEGKIDQIKFIRNNVLPLTVSSLIESPLIKFQEYQFHLNLRYHSSVNYFPKNIRAHKDINIPFWNTQLPTELNDLHSRISFYEDDLNLSENHFCTYAFDDEHPMGSLLSIGWFKKDWIDDFIKIENNEELRIFPRYIHRISEYENIERFCWENHIYLNYIQEQIDESKAVINNLKEIVKRDGREFNDILDANYIISAPDVGEL